jgi:hypothetical protein
MLPTTLSKIKKDRGLLEPPTILWLVQLVPVAQATPRESPATTTVLIGIGLTKNVLPACSSFSELASHLTRIREFVKQFLL